MEVDSTIQRHLVSGWLRTGNDRDAFLSLEALDAVAKLPSTPKSPLGKAHALLAALVRLSKAFGDSLVVHPKTDLSLGYCETEAEFTSLIEYLSSTGHLDIKEPKTLAETGIIVSVAMPGWAEVDELQKQEGGERSDTVFVAMSFDKELRPVYDNAIRPAIEAAGYQACRVDDLQHTGKICDRIVSELKRAAFVVADFTGQKSGVYYEAGFAHGHGLKVIFACKAEDFDRLHFDTRQYNHIKWQDAEELRAQLTERILAVIGRGPRAAGR